MVKLFLCLLKHVLKTYGVMEVESHTFLVLTLVGGELSAAYPVCFAFEVGAYKYTLEKEKM